MSQAEDLNGLKELLSEHKELFSSIPQSFLEYNENENNKAGYVRIPDFYPSL